MKSGFFNTIAFRLTLWFTGIFSVCSAVAFTSFYYFSVQTTDHRIDQDLLDKAATFTTVIRRAGLAGARELAVIEAQAAGEKQIFFRLFYPTGEVFALSHMSYWQDVGISNAALRKMMVEKKSVFETIVLPGSRAKARILYAYVAQNAILQTGLSTEPYEQVLTAYKRIFIATMLFILILSAVAGWMLVQKTMSGVKTITKTAQNITGPSLSARVPITGNKDELDFLAGTFNHMLDRIEALVKSIREMSDNIAHDLKSPITRIRGFAELALVHEDNIDNYRQMAATTIEESDRLLDMINTMLLISKAEAGEEDFVFEIVDISGLLNEACELFGPTAEDKSISIHQNIAPNIQSRADKRMLQRAISNLLDNAIKYTPEKGRVTVSLGCEQGEMQMTFQDTGIGIDPLVFDRIFERFYRAESSRTTPGTGLGLSLARMIIEKHNGSITVDSEPGKGASFFVRLPINNLDVI